jgi:hypothetical protein
MQRNLNGESDSQSDETIELTDRSETSMVKDRADVKPVGVHARRRHWFRSMQDYFNEKDPVIFAAFIKRQDKEFKDKEGWMGKVYAGLVEQQANDWDSDRMARFSRYCKGKGLYDPETMPMGNLWGQFAAQQREERNKYGRPVDCMPPAENPGAEDLAKVKKERERVGIELQKDPGHVARIKEIHDKWQAIGEMRIAEAELAAQEEAKPALQEKPKRTLQIQKITKENEMAEKTIPQLIKNWNQGVLALASDCEQSSEETEKPAELAPGPGTAEHWNRYVKRAEQHKPSEKSVSSDVEQRDVPIKKTGSALWSHDHRVKLGIFEPEKLHQKNDDHYKRQKDRRANKAEEKRQLKELTKEDRAKERKQCNTDRMREKRASSKAQKTGNASTADQEEKSFHS